MVIDLMENFTKYYSYNQVIEEHDVLIMTEQEYLTNKDLLENPQRIVLVNREGGLKEPKVPKWFQSYKKESDVRFEKIEKQLDELKESKIPEWFQSYKKESNVRFEKIETRLDNIENKLNGSEPPRWFAIWCKQEFKPLVKRIENIEEVLKRNNLQ